MKLLAHHMLRLVAMALLLPALLVPSGWAWRWCFCEAMRSASVETEASCCRERSVPNCCEAERPAQSEHHDCGACRSYSPDNHVTAPSLPTLPPAALIASTTIEWSAPRELATTGRSVAVAARGPAPPGAHSLVPLRI